MTIEDRIDRLERQNRWLKGGLGSFLVVVLAGVLFGFASQTSVPDVLKARAFQVVGRDGTVLVALDTMEGGDGAFRTWNRKGRPIVRIGATDDGGAGLVMTLNDKGQRLVQLSATTNGDGMVNTWNSQGQHLVVLAATTSGIGAVSTHDPSGIQSPGILMPR